MKTKSRRYLTYAQIIDHEGHSYAINNSQKHGLYPQMLKPAIDQLNICMDRWRRVFVIRFDLHQHEYTENSLMISRFRKNLARKLERQYGISAVGYYWVREREKVKNQHYHVALFLDGNLIRHPSALVKIITETWGNLNTGNSTYYPKHCYYNVVDNQSRNEVVYRLSYFAKSRG
ncbi:inovirus Gp2 family protein, partial [Granulosicoccus sp.]|nr:inovirus Gp2 family protein [Granulosicoccus sp.]